MTDWRSTHGDCGDRGPHDARQRAVTPVVSKALELGLVVLFVAGLSTALYGGVVPDYRDAAGDDVAERVVVGTADRIEAAVPPPARAVAVEHRVPLPDTVRGSAYRVVADGERLRLVHPSPAVAASAALVLPDRVLSVEGRWESGMDTRVVIDGGDGRLRVELVSR